MDSRAQELIKQGDNLFGKKASLLNFWQELAENFHPIRADFTSKITDGDDLTGHLSTSYPLLAFRDLHNSFSSMLRRRGTHWFGIRTGRDELEEGANLEWLEWATGIQYRAMYDSQAKLIRATKEGDGDFALTGQAVISVDKNRFGDALLFRNWHLRDVAWAENAEGDVDTIHRKWKPTARDLKFTFGDRVHSAVNKCLEPGKNPFQTFECRHVMIPTERAGDVPRGQGRFAFRSYYIDVENQHVMEDAPSRLLRYIVPRWQTVSGSPYAYSPAAIAALPDSRMIQAMTYTLLDAGEKATQPPMIAQADMIKSDMEMWAGGTTWVDAEYDERLGDALRPVPLDLRGIPIGVDMARDARQMIASAFYLDKLNLPPSEGREMTAYETSQRVQEYIRQALPLFEPVETEYNGALCMMAFETLLHSNAFAGREMPADLSDANVEFKFTSPLQENESRQDAQIYLETKALLADAAALDPSLVGMVDARVALRDALKGVGTPARWTRTDDELDEIAAMAEEELQGQQVIDGLTQAGEAAQSMGAGAAAMNEAMSDA